MSSLIESFQETIAGVPVQIDHTGKSRLDEPNKEHLRGLIEDDLKAGKFENFYPYSNFECSVNWKAIDNA